MDLPPTPQDELVVSTEGQQNPALIYLASLTSPHSRRNMQRHLTQMAAGMLHDMWSRPLKVDFDDERAYRRAQRLYQRAMTDMPWHALRFQHVAAVRSHLSDELKPATVNAMLSALRGVMKTAWKLGQMSAEDYHRAAEVGNIRHRTQPAGRDLSVDEVIALLRACCAGADDAIGHDRRDAAIIALLVTVGLRRAELSALNYDDYDQESGELRIRAAKGRRERVNYVQNTPRFLLQRWLIWRGDHPGSLFERIKSNDEAIPGKGISAQAIYNMVKLRARQAGVRDFSPHDLRRTSIGEMLDRGIDLATVSEIVGHASPETTKRYDRRGARALKAAADKMDLNLD